MNTHQRTQFINRVESYKAIGLSPMQAISATQAETLLPCGCIKEWNEHLQTPAFDVTKCKEGHKRTP